MDISLVMPWFLGFFMNCVNSRTFSTFEVGTYINWKEPFSISIFSLIPISVFLLCSDRFCLWAVKCGYNEFLEKLKWSFLMTFATPNKQLLVLSVEHRLWWLIWFWSS
ncbi:hypothetical protein TorRG33x02_263150 [Trema orientale]|uniref:Uncharacterized protein n=1 Tax=Trema orientale TaxID=63057 RepID=A0A2P5D427_TREOI|nr:hypothetical protein TorRG33x02_263150 [Trema orientale]